MPKFKERPKMDKPKTKPVAMPPRQAAHILKENYRKQLDQRQSEAGSETSYAADQVEGAGRWATDEVVSHAPQPCQHRKNALKERSRSEGKSDPAEGRTTQRPKQKPKNNVANAAKGRTTPAVKECTTLGKAPASQTVSPKAMPRQVAPAAESHRTVGGQFCFHPPKREPMTKPPELSTPGSGKVSRPQGSTKNAGAIRERTRTIFKTRSGPTVKPSTPAMKVKPPVARATKRAARQTAQRQMTQRMVARAQKAAKATMVTTQKVAQAVARAVVSLFGSLVGSLGGGVLLMILLMVVIIAAVVSSPFGIFFAGGSFGGGSASATVSVAEAVAQVNREYNAKLEDLQAGGYDSIELAGAAADWPDVLAVFASRYAAAEDGVDVATLDADRVSKLTATFWDMTAITSMVETIDHPDSDPDDDTDDSWTEYILHITITAKTAEDMKTAYGFTAYQISAMDELLADRAALSSLAGRLAITSVDALTVLNTLPDGLALDRHKAVETALQLVGKVNYFWGGKSYVIGWDSRWGQLMKVTSDGSSTTGSFRPFGLDCTGFMDWTLRNAGLPSDGHWYIGTNLTEVSWSEALPGDIALYSDASHVGMVVGRDSAGKLLVCHCSSGANNVVISDCDTSGFTSIGRPAIYGP